MTRMSVFGVARRSLWAPAVVLLAACASTTIRDSWFDPSVRTLPFGKILVVTVGGDFAQRRIFEDAVAARLENVGVRGEPGYRTLPDAKATEAQMEAAVARAGADGMMLVRLGALHTHTEVRSTRVPGLGAPGPGWHGWYGSWYAVPEVTQVRISTVETTVFDVPTRKLVWTGVTQTFDPASFRTEAAGLADAIVGALAAHKLTPSGKS